MALVLGSLFGAKITLDFVVIVVSAIAGVSYNSSRRGGRERGENKEHTNNQRPSNRNKHEKGNARK